MRIEKIKEGSKTYDNGSGRERFPGLASGLRKKARFSSSKKYKNVISGLIQGNELSRIETKPAKHLTNNVR